MEGNSNNINKTENPFSLKDDERENKIITIHYTNFDNSHENFKHLEW